MIKREAVRSKVEKTEKIHRKEDHNQKFLEVCEYDVKF